MNDFKSTLDCATRLDLGLAAVGALFVAKWSFWRGSFGREARMGCMGGGGARAEGMHGRRGGECTAGLVGCCCWVALRVMQRY